MKSAAVDCKLNIQENKDETFDCLSLEGKVGDFMYHPDLDKDISESASQFQVRKKKPVAVAAALQAPNFIKQKFIKHNLSIN
jgi:hypothetical protein